MDKSAAIRLIADTFSQPFEETRYRRFVGELLNRYDHSPDRQFTRNSASVKASYEEYIYSFRRLGVYTDPHGDEMDLLVVHLKKDGSLQSARTMQRNFIADHLKTRGSRDCALVAYYREGQQDWRFRWCVCNINAAPTKPRVELKWKSS